MIVLHAATLAGRLLAWGETSQAAQGRKGRRRAERLDPRPLPHDAGEDQLRHALAAAAVVTRTGLARPFTAWLPTREETAIPSSALIADVGDPETRANTRLSAYNRS